MPKKYLLNIMAFFLFVAAFGQKDAAYSNLTNGIGTEGVYVHYNTNLLFSGEYLNFKLYALSKINQSLSSASKMAYVELLDESGERKIIQKVKLIDGMGQGDIFIPTNLDSGYYTLVAYTAYMKNWSTDTFYSDELIILNPYTNDQEIFWGDKSVSGNNASGSAGTITDTSLELVLNKALFGTREKVELELVPTSNYKGNYSISVRKVYKDLDYGERTSPRDYTKKFTAIDPNPIGAEHLPELRGEIIKGEISSKDGLETTNKKVVFSLPGEAYEYRMVSTDSDGVFMFSLDSENLDTESLFQVWGADKEHYSVTIDDVPEIKYANKTSKHFVLDREMKDVIEKRSTHNQIENAYFNSKPDTVLINNNFIPLYGKRFFEYVLDEYTRFPTFRETLVEIVDNAWIANNDDGKQNIFVRDFEATNMDVGYSPLVIVDGIVIQEHEDLINYDIKRVKAIRIARNQFVVGGQIFQGVFDVETFDADFVANYQKGYLYGIELLRPEPQKKYFKQDYSNDRFAEIPDFRHQLLWQPNFALEDSTIALEFYTSDLEGEFEVVVEGFTEQMQPVKVVKRFNVQ